MQNKKEKERLNLYISEDLLKRLEYCSERFGVSRTQLAVMLIGQGIAGIEKSINVVDDIAKDLEEDIREDIKSRTKK